jgi:hypothetical protein
MNINNMHQKKANKKGNPNDVPYNIIFRQENLPKEKILPEPSQNSCFVMSKIENRKTTNIV